MLGLVGFTAMDTSVAEVTVSKVEPDMLPDVAVIVVEPADTEEVNPLEPAALLMPATAASDELQVTVVVTSCVVLSENVPVATNCWIEPLTMLGLVGVIAMDTSVAEVTVTMVDPDMFPISPRSLPCQYAWLVRTPVCGTSWSMRLMTRIIPRTVQPQYRMQHSKNRQPMWSRLRSMSGLVSCCQNKCR